MGRDEAEAAYFTLLRAREELDQLRRYHEYLRAERQRLQRFTREGEALDDTVAAGQRRVVRHTDEALTNAIRARLAVIDDETARLPDREAAAAAFVDECEHRYHTLRSGA